MVASKQSSFARNIDCEKARHYDRSFVSGYLAGTYPPSEQSREFQCQVRVRGPQRGTPHNLGEYAEPLDEFISADVGRAQDELSNFRSTFAQARLQTNERLDQGIIAEGMRENVYALDATDLVQDLQQFH